MHSLFFILEELTVQNFKSLKRSTWKALPELEGRKEEFLAVLGSVINQLLLPTVAHAKLCIYILILLNKVFSYEYDKGRHLFASAHWASCLCIFRVIIIVK